MSAQEVRGAVHSSRTVPAAASAAVLLPLTAGAVSGRLIGSAEHIGAAGRGAVSIWTHNAGLALATAVLGLLSLGALALLMAGVGWFVNGYALGSYLSSGHSLPELLGHLPHLVPELAAFVLATAVGLSGAARALASVRGRRLPPRRQWARDCALRAGAAVLLLIPAAVLEAAT
ncbi:stage II sporulation protein M [Streptomyces cyaneofuscatus]|uniref:stage II sporulation protein M n=1 Tax=Streptomyces cyaneofuscatus TaxID=66883 RepID=UPI0034224F73